jgi:S-adenosylmethionine hydrolase
MMRRIFISYLVFSLSFILKATSQSRIVVFQSDFGLKDGAVSAMKGVAMGVSPDLKLYDLTHEIPAYDIWEGAYRLMQTVPYWPEGTVFVSVVDPGVGTSRKSVVAKTKTGQYIVTPDNGTLTLLAETLGITEMREIDEAVNRRKNSEKSYTFHGRDVYAFTGARLAAGVITYEQVGKALPAEPVMLSYQKAVLSGNMIKGNIPVLDIQYGNVWTNIGADLFNQWKLKAGDKLQVSIYNKSRKVYEGIMPYVETFGAVAKGKPLAYLNSLLQLSFALNMQNFAQVYRVSSGSDWSVQIKKLN